MQQIEFESDELEIPVFEQSRSVSTNDHLLMIISTPEGSYIR